VERVHGLAVGSSHRWICVSASELITDPLELA
jgi:hypothetical protein